MSLKVPAKIRRATLKDRATFAHLWAEFLREQDKNGHAIIACDENMRTFINLFESYISGGLFGVTLLAEVEGEPAGVLMGGENPSMGFYLQTKHGRIATLWGVYILPEWRRKGIAWALQDESHQVAIQMGFQTMMSSVSSKSPGAKENALGWGANATEFLITFPLGQAEHGHQRSS